jgi:hypothetical protein
MSRSGNRCPTVTIAKILLVAVIVVSARILGAKEKYNRKRINRP